MTKRRIILALVVFSSLAVFAVQTWSQTRGSNPRKPLDLKRLQKMTEEERRRDVKRRLQELKRQDELRHQEHRRKTAEIRREKAQKRKQQRLQREQRQQELKQELKKEREEAGGIACWFAKVALGETEEQWNLIQPKLKKVIDLWYRANSTIGAGVSGGSTDSRREPSLPKLQWERPWKYKPLFELTEAQRLARQLRILLEKKDTPPEVFRRKVAALRKARSKEAEIQKQLAEARRELREGLTTRQEAVLVLKGWL
jgi:hypothetical protein